MIEGLKSWVVNICAALFFITAVEMILPNNSMKKYAKFVLGLLLMMIIINPILKIFNNNFDVQTYANKVTESFEIKGHEKSREEYKEKNLESTLQAFKMNLENACEKTLAQKYPTGKYKVEVAVRYNKETESFIIKNATVNIKTSGIEKISKVDINTNSKPVQQMSSIESEESKKIRACLGEVLNLSGDAIIVNQL